ncbi:MAG: helix-turn-helix transcriptional regulator [Firmicutes bacterium]|nr:helix-turn-helix transcriptional regulator [Bacillota bacterium]
MLEIYKNIKRLRKEHGWTQTELAQRVGYADKGMVSRVENGRVDLPQSLIIKFAQVLGVSPGDLMGDDGVSYDLAKDEKQLINTYRSLSDPGKKRVRNYASSVLNLESQEQELYAAHHREGVTDISDHDRAIMEDDSEWDE